MYVCAPSQRRKRRFGRFGGCSELRPGYTYASAAAQSSGVVLVPGDAPVDS